MVEVKKLVPKERKGLVVVITGHGKGKTTTALGLAVRACGHNMRVCIIQFMKGDLYSGEWDGVRKMDCRVELIPTGKGFCGIQGNPYPYQEHRKNAQDAIGLAREKMASGQPDVLILDEVNNAVQLRLVDLEQVLDIIRGKPPLMHLVLTGRDAHEEVIRLADTVSQEWCQALTIHKSRMVSGLDNSHTSHVTFSSMIQFAGLLLLVLCPLPSSP